MKCHNLDVGIVRLKTYRDQKVNDLLNMFKIPTVDYTKGYQTKPRPELMGGSAVNTTEALRLQAVNGLLRWTRQSVS
jgi:ribonuclease HII